MGVNCNRVEHFDCHEREKEEEEETKTQTQTEIPMPPSLEIHQVRLPPERSTPQKLRQRLSEIFFPDDPLHRFKNQPCFAKLLLTLQCLFPIFQWGPQYNLTLLRSDLISGLTIASLAIPQVRFMTTTTCMSQLSSLMFHTNMFWFWMFQLCLFFAGNQLCQACKLATYCWIVLVFSSSCFFFVTMLLLVQSIYWLRW